MTSESKLTDSVVLGGGCFWCLDAVYRHAKGINESTCGYSAGDTVNPDYSSVSSGSTGHAEVVRVIFQPGVISLDSVLDIFFTIHDPTTINRQGADVGSQYRSIILTTNHQQLKSVNGAMDRARAIWDNPLVTEVQKLKNFYEAEPEHQNYFNKNPERGYCNVVINPKLIKFRTKYKNLLL